MLATRLARATFPNDGESSMTTPTPIEPVLRINAYKQGKSTLDGIKNPIKLSSNESSHGPCGAAIEAFKQASTALNRYPDGSQQQLRQALASTYQLNSDKIMCGNGSEELIGLVVRTFINCGDEALLSENGFIMSNIYCMAQGAELVIAPETDYKVDVDELLSRVTEKTKFCTIANPNNPTGTYISDSEMRRLHAGLPKDCIFLVDNAYAEYVDDEDFSDGSAMVEEFDNVIMTRTFSKIYGLPALRIGWLYASQAIHDFVQRIRTPFNANSAAMAAATAAVQDTAYTDMIKQHNIQALDYITSALTALGIEVVPSVANFYLLNFAKIEGKSGGDAGAYLQKNGIIPRPGGGDLLRITVGLDEENKAVIDVLTQYMQS